MDQRRQGPSVHLAAFRGTARYDTARYDTARYDTARYGTTRRDTVREDSIDYGSARGDGDEASARHLAAADRIHGYLVETVAIGNEARLKTA